MGAGSAATRIERVTRHAHMRAATVRRMLRRKQADPNRHQQHPYKGDGNRRFLAESTQHGVSLSRTGNLAVTGVTPLSVCGEKLAEVNQSAAETLAGIGTGAACRVTNLCSSQLACRIVHPARISPELPPGGVGSR